MEPKIKIGKKEYTISKVKTYSKLFLILGIFIIFISFFIMPIGIILLILGIYLILCSFNYRKLIKASQGNISNKEIQSSADFNRPKSISSSSSLAPTPLPFETDWKEFNVHAKHKSSNRFRTVKILAKSRDICEKLAEGQGLLPPYEISELPPNVPSEKQLSYAKDLHIEFPSDITSRELSDLIDRKVNNGGGAPQTGLAEFAVAHGMHFSRYIGKNRLYDLIFENLQGPDKIAFFIFSVYRWMSDDRDANLDEHKYKERFYEFAQKLQGNSKFIKSMERYSGRNIKFFGTLYAGGYEHEGGSINTIAYKTVSDYLESELGLHRSGTKNVS